MEGISYSNHNEHASASTQEVCLKEHCERKLGRKNISDLEPSFSQTQEHFSYSRFVHQAFVPFIRFLFIFSKLLIFRDFPSSYSLLKFSHLQGSCLPAIYLFPPYNETLLRESVRSVKAESLGSDSPTLVTST